MLKVAGVVGVLGAAVLWWILSTGGVPPDELLGPVPADRGIVVPPGMKRIGVLEQNWSHELAAWFYNEPQGSKLLPYRWFLHLERAQSQASFRSDAHMQELGFLPRKSDAVGNPDGLPIGFVKDPTPDASPSLGLTCAACHTGMVHMGETAYVIDGGPALSDLETLLVRLEAALRETLNEDAKFTRFASKVLGAGASDDDRRGLRADLKAILLDRMQYNRRNMPSGGQPHYGHGRVDAFGAIMNEVTVRFLGVEANQRPAAAPVSYPFLWDTPQHNVVQWNGAAPNKVVDVANPVIGTEHVGALGRNIGEVLGVFGNVDPSQPSTVTRSYPSSINRPNLIQLEEGLRSLWSPLFPRERLDDDLVARGKLLYAQQNCADCHGTPESFDRTSPARRVEANMKNVGTDPGMAVSVSTRRAETGIIQGRWKTWNPLDRFGDEASFDDIIGHMVLRTMLGKQTNLGRELTEDEMLALEFPFSSPIAAFEIPGEGALVGQFEDVRFDRARKQFSFAERSKFEVIQTPGVQKPIQTIQAGLPTAARTRSWAGPLRGTDAERSAMREEIGKSLRKRIPKIEFLSVERDASMRIKGLRTQSGKNVALKDLTFLQTTTEGVTASEDEEGPVARRVLLPQGSAAGAKYKARPLNGIWATAPYLHNGSVPNLEQLLTAPASRVTTFHVGSRELDEARGGFRSDVGPFVFDATKPGNSNDGHDFGTGLSPADRRALIEYLKSL